MSRKVGVVRSRFQRFAAPVIAGPLQDCGAPKAHFTVSLGQPRKLSGLKARLTFGLGTKRCMNRAFSACPVGHQIRGAMPHVRHGESVLWRSSTENSAFDAKQSKGEKA